MGIGDAAQYTPRLKIHNVHWLIKDSEKIGIKTQNKNPLKLIKAIVSYAYWITAPFSLSLILRKTPKRLL